MSPVAVVIAAVVMFAGWLMAGALCVAARRADDHALRYRAPKRRREEMGRDLGVKKQGRSA